jgi:hypothetical protein
VPTWPRQTLAAAALSLLLVAGAAALHRDIGSKYIVLASGHAFDPLKVRKDRMGRAVGCHSLMRDTNYKACVFGRKTSSRRIFLIGDSHAVQWFTAVDAVAKKRHMALHLRTKDACLVMETPLLSAKLGRVLNECGQWRVKLLDEIEQLKPEVVLIAYASHHTPAGPDGVKRLSGSARLTALAQGERALIERIAATGAQVVMIADTPMLPVDPLDCLLQNSGRTDLCRWPKQNVFHEPSPWSFSHDSPPVGVGIVDMTDAICRGDFCYAASDDYVIMRDEHHVTASFGASLAGKFDRRLKKALRHAKTPTEITNSRASEGEAQP